MGEGNEEERNRECVGSVAAELVCRWTERWTVSGIATWMSRGQLEGANS